MKWLLAITMALILTGCATSSAVASQLANEAKTKSVETLQTVSTKVETLEIQLIPIQANLSMLDRIAKREARLESNRESLNEVVLTLLRRVGKTPYVFSGSTPYGWDCSGMVRWAYEQLGVELPHSATKQAYVGERVDTPKVGDIVLFGYKGYESFYHSAIYIGKDKVVNANRGFGGTEIEPLTNYEGSRIVYVRILETP